MLHNANLLAQAQAGQTNLSDADTQAIAQQVTTILLSGDFINQLADAIAQRISASQPAKTSTTKHKATPTDG